MNRQKAQQSRWVANIDIASNGQLTDAHIDQLEGIANVQSQIIGIWLESKRTPISSCSVPAVSSCAAGFIYSSCIGWRHVAWLRTTFDKNSSVLQNMKIEDFHDLREEALQIVQADLWTSIAAEYNYDTRDAVVTNISEWTSKWIIKGNAQTTYHAKKQTARGVRWDTFWQTKETSQAMTYLLHKSRIHCLRRPHKTDKSDQAEYRESTRYQGDCDRP